MKLRILYTILITGMLSSCFEDDSNVEINPVSPIRIDFGDISNTISVYSMDTLRLNPIVYKTGTDDADLSFEWVLTDINEVQTYLGNTMQLNAEITVPASANTYDLLFTVTDNTTGLKEYESFTVTVQPPLGRGLLIADTKDEVNSDLHLVMSSNFTIASNEPYSDKDTKIYYSIFSKYNGNLIDGLVNGIDAQMDRWGSGEPTLTVTTPKTLLRMHPHEYIVEMKDKELFLVAPEEDSFIPQTVMNVPDASFVEILNVSGTIYTRKGTDVNYYYGAALRTPDFSDCKIGMFCGSRVLGDRYSAYYYDEIGNRFFTSEGDHTEFLSIGTTSTTPFNPNNIGPKNALYMGFGRNLMYTLFKTEGAEDYSLYIAQPKNLYYDAFEPLSIYSFESTSNIQNAVAYTSSVGEPIFYWATESTIYSLNTESKAIMPCLSIADLDPEDPNAKITSIQIFDSFTEYGNYGKVRVKDPMNDKGYSEKSAVYNMMMITIYNGTYGKVICVPIPNLGSGMLEKDRTFHRIYEGQEGNRFGRIVYLGVQDL